MFYVGLVRRKVKWEGDPELFICVRSEPFSFRCVVFNEKSASVAVRRYIKSNLSADIGLNDSMTRKEQRALHRQWIISGDGPCGFEVDYGDCRK